MMGLALSYNVLSLQILMGSRRLPKLKKSSFSLK